MNKKRTTPKLSAREISTIINQRSKNYILWIGISTVLVLVIGSLSTVGFTAFDYTIGSTLYVVALFMVLMLVPSFLQHLVRVNRGDKSRAATVAEPVSFSILRWSSVVTLGLVLVNSRELWNNMNSLDVSFIALLDVIAIVAVGSLVALVMAGRYYDKKWKTPAGLTFTAVAGVACALQLFAVVYISV